jgi:hypothetical protein
MKGGQKGLKKGDRAQVNYGTGPPVEGKVFQSSAKGTPDNTDAYKLQWDDGKASDWIPESKVTKVTNPPEPTGQGRKTRKRKTSKRRKTYRR